MKIIRKIGHSLFYKIITSINDPLQGQRNYVRGSLEKKLSSIPIKQCNKEINLKIIQLWGGGGVNRWFDFYNTIDEGNRAYLYFPDDWFYDHVDAKLNNWKVCKSIDDKSLYDFFFYDVTRPKTVACCMEGQWLDDKFNISDICHVSEICKEEGGVIIKPSIGVSGGRGISFWQFGEKPIDVLLSNYQNCVVQSIIEQHPDISAIHKESINSIRILTMLLDGDVKILSSVLRMGVGDNRVDNVSSGGVACGIDENGCLRAKSYNKKGQSWDGHPSGLQLKGRIIPAYEDCCIIAKRVAPRFARFSRLISWDFAVDKKGKPLLIEANLYGGEIDFHQMCNGPIFGDVLTTKKMVERFYKQK